MTRRNAHTDVAELKVELVSITKDSEKLIEEAGRTSHLSNNNTAPGSEMKFIHRLIAMGHLSVLEHASATFKISGVSRTLTHQLVRHRICSFTQQSQRYVDEQGFRFIEPPSIKGDVEAHNLFIKNMDVVRETYQLLQSLGIANEDARFILPNATETQIVMTANFREWRHIIELRGNKGAQWEIRALVVSILKMLKENAPSVFDDFTIDYEKNIIAKTKA